MTHRSMLVPTTFIVCVLLAVGVIGMTHANQKHLEAPLVRASIRQGVCQAKEIWFAPASGRILFLCQMENNSVAWGGWIIFVAQDNGHRLIQPHEATVFVANRHYWQEVIKRDGYVLALNFPTVLDHAADTLGVPLP